MNRQVVRSSVQKPLMQRLFSHHTHNAHQFHVQGNLLDAKVPTVGHFATLHHTFHQSDVTQFSKTSGDNNPIHVDPEAAKKSIFGSTIVHGILVSSLFSTIFGRGIPGAIYVSQSLNFKRPVHVGTAVIAEVRVLKVENKKKGDLVTCSTVVKLPDETHAIEGEASVLIPREL